MNREMKKYLTGTLVSVALMFIWIFITVILTGGKETSEFSDIDNKIFIGFIIVEIITCVTMFVFAVKLGKLKKDNSKNNYVQKTKQERIIVRRGWLLLTSACVLAFLSMLAGIIAGGNIDSSLNIYFKWLLGACFVIPALLFPLNIVLKNNYLRKLESKQIGEMQRYIISHREFAEETSAEKFSLVKKIRILTDIYAVILGVFAFGITFSAGVLYDTNFTVIMYFASAFFFLGALARIRFSTPKVIYDEDKTYVSAGEYPELYALAKKAADTLHCKGEIRIAVLANCNAGIARTGNLYSVQLGVILLGVLSKDELYNILLHEFSHVTNDNNDFTKEGNYNFWVCNGGNSHFFSGLTSILFSYPDTVYSFQYNLYLYAASILLENAADQAMIQYGNTEAAASSLLKTKYYELFDWEKGTYDEDCFFEPETPDKLVLTKEIASFKNAIKLNKDKWNNLVSVEILSRSASHPTLKMRLEALGVDEYRIIEEATSCEYINECEKALSYVEELIYQERIKTYEDDRKAAYLEPKQMVEAWEEAGKPLIAEEYGDISFALRQLGRGSESNQLCERAIAELSKSASCYAYYIKGCYLLHCYDEAGIDYIYHAIENNTNYIEEGLEMIGEFCCLTGRQQELDIYREKAVEIAQMEKDKYSQIGVLNKNDNLSIEQLPEGMLDDILNYIQSIDKGYIQNIYLVRKTISDDFFTSAFVIKFDLQTEADIQNEVLHKIFCYLDTCSDWQFSLFNYMEVANVRVETIENSCIYTKNVS